MKIKELQGGGLLTYTPSNPPQLQIPGSSQSSPFSSGLQAGGEDQLLSKEVVKLLLENGLSNDVDAYLRLLNKISSTISHDPRQANQMMLSQYSYINKIILNKSSLEDSIKRADSNHGLNELAITTTGQILVENMDTGKIDLVSAKELKDNLDILRPLTNSELVQRRQTDPSLAFNTSIASVVGNGVGPDKITSYILGIAGKIGQSKHTSEGYINKKEQNIAEGIQALLSGGEDGVYKISTTQSDPANLVSQALKYVYSTLPQNMKNFLHATAALNGNDPHKGALQLIQDMITSTVSTEDSTRIGFDSSQTELMNKRLGISTKGSSGEDKEGINQDQSILIASGKGTPRNYQLNTGTNYTIDVSGEFWQTPHTKGSNEPINKSMTVQRLLTDTSVAGLVDPGSVYLGSLRISEDGLKNVVYNNADGFMTTLLPYTTDGQGHKIPDFGALEELSKVKDEIKNKGMISDLEKRLIYSAHNLGEYYIMSELDPEQINYNVVAPFLIFSGITSNDADIGIKGIDKKDPLLNVNDPYYKTMQIGIFEQAVNEPETKGGKPGKDSVYNWYNSLGLGNDDIIAGTVYIPLTEDKFSTYSANKQFKVPKLHGFAEYLMRNDAIRRNREALGPTNINILGD